MSIFPPANAQNMAPTPEELLAEATRFHSLQITRNVVLNYNTFWFFIIVPFPDIQNTPGFFWNSF